PTTAKSADRPPSKTSVRSSSQSGTGSNGSLTASAKTAERFSCLPVTSRCKRARSSTSPTRALYGTGTRCGNGSKKRTVPGGSTCGLPTPQSSRSLDRQGSGATHNCSMPSTGGRRPDQTRRGLGATTLNLSPQCASSTEVSKNGKTPCAGLGGGEPPDGPPSGVASPCRLGSAWCSRTYTNRLGPVNWLPGPCSWPCKKSRPFQRASLELSSRCATRGHL